MNGKARRNSPKCTDVWRRAFLWLQNIRFIFPAQVNFPEANKLTGREQMRREPEDQGTWEEPKETHFHSLPDSDLEALRDGCKKRRLLPSHL